MTITQRLSLLWQRFSPLEERLLAAVRTVLSAQASHIFDAQVAAINLVQRHPNEICFYRRKFMKVNWSDIPGFPRTSEFLVLAERAGDQFILHRIDPSTT